LSDPNWVAVRGRGTRIEAASTRDCKYLSLKDLELFPWEFRSVCNLSPRVP
jgi:hypothetical protein